MYGRETWGTDIVSSGVAMLTGYVMTSWGKNTSNPLYPLIGNVLIGAGGVGLKHMARNEYLHESLEAVGYTGFGNVGNWAAEATMTFGGKAAGAPPVYLPKSAASGSLSRAAQARVQAEIARRTSQGDIVQPLQPQPGRTATVYQYPANESVA